MNKPIQTSVLMLSAVILSGCLSTGVSPQNVAPVLPASIAAPTATQLLEPLKGGLIGGDLGKGLTPPERQRGLVAEYQALETSFGQAPVVWQDGKTGNSGEVVAGAPYRVGQQDCRPYSHKLVFNAVIASAAGSACRQSNGAWLLLQ